jgi:hypothetical protein
MHKGDYFMNAATFRLGRETPMHIILLKYRLLNLHFDLHMMYTYTYSAPTVYTYMVKNTIHTYIHTHICIHYFASRMYEELQLLSRTTLIASCTYTPYIHCI